MLYWHENWGSAKIGVEPNLDDFLLERLIEQAWLLSVSAEAPSLNDSRLARLKRQDPQLCLQL